MTEKTIHGTIKTGGVALHGSIYRATREGGEPYEGEYTVVPTQERQELQTAGKSLLLNVVVEPIPQNYGLIGWNGAVLTVS